MFSKYLFPPENSHRPIYAPGKFRKFPLSRSHIWLNISPAAPGQDSGNTEIPADFPDFPNPDERSSIFTVPPVPPRSITHCGEAPYSATTI
jgi:hypothetical protein